MSSRLAWVLLAAVLHCARRQTLAPPPLVEARVEHIPEPQPLPQATVKPEPCAVAELRRSYLSGRWKDGELLAQRCLQQNPLTTEARVVLVRMYLMRAYAAHEPRWLDEARRQLKMVASDPAFSEEARELTQLVEQPMIE